MSSLPISGFLSACIVNYVSDRKIHPFAASAAASVYALAVNTFKANFQRELSRIGFNKICIEIVDTTLSLTLSIAAYHIISSLSKEFAMVCSAGLAIAVMQKKI